MEGEKGRERETERGRGRDSQHSFADDIVRENILKKKTIQHYKHTRTHAHTHTFLVTAAYPSSIAWDGVDVGLNQNSAEPLALISDKLT